MPRITNIEVAQKNLPLRIVLLVLAIAIAIGAFAYGISSALSTKPGWAEIEASTSGLNCSEDFVLSYNLGAGETSATAESKALKLLYGQLTENAYQIFDNGFESEDVHNIRYVNSHINEEITVEPALHKALSAIAGSGNRSIYLAPVYALYLPLLLCENDISAAQCDPQKQPEILEFISQTAAFANNPDMINIEILDGQKLVLRVAQEYLTFAEQNEISYFLDFSWMTNAFIADYIADALIENGYTNGYLASHDGYTRNLCSAEQYFSLNVFQRVDKDVIIPATWHYPGGTSVVTLRDFPLSEDDRWSYYAYEDGRIASVLIDPADGKEKSVTSAMTCYASTASCSDILLNMAPLYLAETLDTQQVSALKEKGIFTLLSDGKAIYTNDTSLQIQLYEGYSKVMFE